MKKILSIGLVLVSIFILVGCENKNGSKDKSKTNDSFEGVANALCDIYNNEESTYEDLLGIMHSDMKDKVSEMISEDTFYESFRDNISKCRWEPMTIEENKKEETIKCFEDMVKEEFNADIELVECSGIILYDDDKRLDGVGICKNKKDGKWHYYDEC